MGRVHCFLSPDLPLCVSGCILSTPKSTFLFRFSFLPILHILTVHKRPDMSQESKYRIAIAAALLIGWFIVVFLRSGTAW